MLSAATGLAAATTAATATAAATAGVLGFLDFIVRGDASEFQGHADVFRNLLLDGLEHALSVHKICGYFVIEKSIAGIFKCLDFGGSKLDSGVLLVVEFLAFFVDSLVLELSDIVGKETLYIALQFDELCVVCDLFAEFFGFGSDGWFL